MGTRSKCVVIFSTLMVLLLLLLSCNAEISTPQQLCTVSFSIPSSKSFIGASENAVSDRSGYSIYYKGTNLTDTQAYGHGDTYLPFQDKACFSQGTWRIDVILLPEEKAASYPTGLTEAQIGEMVLGTYHRASSGEIYINLNTTEIPVYLSSSSDEWGRVKIGAYLSEVTPEHLNHDYTLTFYKLGELGFSIYNLTEKENLLQGDSSLKPEVGSYSYQAKLTGTGNSFQKYPAGSFSLKNNGDIKPPTGKASTVNFHTALYTGTENKYYCGIEKEYQLPAGIYLAKIKVRDADTENKNVLFTDIVGFKVNPGTEPTILYGICDTFDGSVSSIYWLPESGDNSSTLYVGEDIQSLAEAVLKDETIYVLNSSLTSPIPTPTEGTAVALDLNGKDIQDLGSPLLSLTQNTAFTLYTSSCKNEGHNCAACTHCGTDCSLCPACTVVVGRSEAADAYRTGSLFTLEGGTLNIMSTTEGCDDLVIQGPTRKNSANDGSNHVKLGAINLQDTQNSKKAGGTVNLSGRVKVKGVKGITSLVNLLNKDTVENPTSALTTDGADIAISLKDGASIDVEGDCNFNGVVKDKELYNDIAAGIYLIGKATAETVSVRLEGNGTSISAFGKKDTSEEPDTKLDKYLNGASYYSVQKQNDNSKKVYFYECNSLGIFLSSIKGDIDITIGKGSSILTDGIPIYLKNCTGNITINVEGTLSTTGNYDVVFDGCTGNIQVNSQEGIWESTAENFYFVDCYGTAVVTTPLSLTAFHAKRTVYGSTEKTPITIKGVEVHVPQQAITIVNHSGKYTLDEDTLKEYESPTGPAIQFVNPTNLELVLTDEGTIDSGRDAILIENPTGKLKVVIENQTVTPGITEKDGNFLVIKGSGKNLTSIEIEINNVKVQRGETGQTNYNTISNGILIDDSNVTQPYETCTVKLTDTTIESNYSCIKFTRMMCETLNLTLDNCTMSCTGSFPIYIGNDRVENATKTGWKNLGATEAQSGNCSKVNLTIKGGLITSNQNEKYGINFYKTRSVNLTIEGATINSRVDAIYFRQGYDPKSDIVVNISGNSVIQGFNNSGTPSANVSLSGYGAIGFESYQASSVAINMTGSSLKTSYYGVSANGLQTGSFSSTLTSTVVSGYYNSKNTLVKTPLDLFHFEDSQVNTTLSLDLQNSCTVTDVKKVCSLSNTTIPATPTLTDITITK